MKREIVLAPEAEVDLEALYDYIAEQSGAARAAGYIGCILKSCASLSEFPERGTRRDDLRPGLRVLGFERRVSVAFHVEPDRVVIDRLLYGGRDLPTLFNDA